jgi:hypothetical protein
MILKFENIKHTVNAGCSFKFPIKVGVEQSIVNAPAAAVSLQIKNTNNAKSEVRCQIFICNYILVILLLFGIFGWKDNN